MYAEIKHHPDAVKTFWFIVPPELRQDIQEGDCVEVQTRRGKRQGFIVQLSPTPGYTGCFRKVLRICQPEAPLEVLNVQLKDLL